MSRRSPLRSLLACIALLGLLAGSSTSVAEAGGQSERRTRLYPRNGGPGQPGRQERLDRSHRAAARGVEDLGARASRNRFGTPRSLIRDGGYLATGVAGATAADAARAWVALTGEAGDDSLAGGGQDDTLDGGTGTDHLAGGGGFDTCLNGETTSSCEAP